MTYDHVSRLIDKYQKAERDLLYYMMQDKKYAMQYEAKAGYMYDKVNRLIASYIIDYYRQYVILEVADLINQLQNYLNDDVMVELNYQVDELNKKTSDVAKQFLIENKLINE